MKNLNKNMNEIYCPDQSLFLEKPIVEWRQYIKRKKHKNKFKFYELGDSSGLILQSMIYSGIPYADPHNLGQTGALGLTLMNDFFRKGYTVYADNLCNSVNLIKHISSNDTYICGTLRKNISIEIAD